MLGKGRKRCVAPLTCTAVLCPLQGTRDKLQGATCLPLDSAYSCAFNSAKDSEECCYTMSHWNSRSLQHCLSTRLGATGNPTGTLVLDKLLRGTVDKLQHETGNKGKHVDLVGFSSHREYVVYQPQGQD